MSEYQYYEFQAIDRPLAPADLKALREISSRARITATSFTNSYEWGDFKGDPAALMKRWFDLHLYLANWGSRRLMIRVPKRVVDVSRLAKFLDHVDWVNCRVAGDALILDIARDEIDIGDHWDDGSGWLAALAPLRAALLAGDLRMFYLLWLTAVEAEDCDEDEREPLPGIGPMSEPLEAFATFFAIDPDLVRAAAERGTGTVPAGEAATMIAAIADGEKNAMLGRVFDGDPYVAAALRSRVMRLAAAGAPPEAVRTAGELRARAEELRFAREQEAETERAAAHARQLAQAEKARRERLASIAQLGDGVWREIESEIERRNAVGYDRAAGLLADLRSVAEVGGTMSGFDKRLQGIRERHAGKRKFIERLAAMGSCR